MKIKLGDILSMVTLIIITILVSSFLFKANFVAKYSDFRMHVYYTQTFAKEGRWPLYTMYYYLLYLFSLKSTNYSILRDVAIGFVSICVSAKIVMSYLILRYKNSNYYLILLACIILIFVTPIVNWWNPTRVYLGQISPNIWHNSTNILAMPFALLLFYYSCHKLGRNNIFVYFLTGILLFLSVLAKPNYALAFLPSYFIYYIYFFYNKKNKISMFKHILHFVLIVVPTVAFLLIQYITTFGDNAVIRPSAGVEFAWFKVWAEYSPHIFISLLLSIAFPLVMLIFYFKEILNDKFTVLAWVIFLCSTLEFMCLTEKGPSYMNANFMWGAITSCFILFLTNVNTLLKQHINYKIIIAWFVLILHLISGLYYYYLLTFRGFWL